jgi:hypothetical protein
MEWNSSRMKFEENEEERRRRRRNDSWDGGLRGVSSPTVPSTVR